MTSEPLPNVVAPGNEIEQIEHQISNLQADLSMIAVQLADRDRRESADGERMDWREYNTWRRKALYARTKKEQQLRELRLRRKELLKLGQQMVLDGEDPIAGHLAHLCHLLIRRAKSGDLTPDEQAGLNAARATLVRAYGDNALGGTVS